MNNFETISTTTLASVTGGTSSSKDTQLTAMLTDISKSIKDAADTKNKGQDPTQLMMMMMMGGMGGGGGSTQVAAAPPPPAPSPAVVRVNVR